MKKEKSLVFKLVMAAVILIAIAAAAYGIFYIVCTVTMLQMGNVTTTVWNLLPYCVPFLIGIFAVIIITDVLNRKGVGTRRLVNGEGIIALVLAFLATVNAICYGPLYTVLNSAFVITRNVEGDVLQEANDINLQVAEEGIVLLKNDDGALPLASDVTKINVFGWNSVNPFYSGGGSGSSTNTGDAVDILQGIKDGGYEVNEELTAIYEGYTYESKGGFVTDWTLPQPTMDYYTEDIMANAKAFSDTAVIVIGRCCGESAEAPMDMTADDVMYYGNEGDYEPGQHYLELTKTERELVSLVNDNFSNVIVLINSANAMELGWLEDYENVNAAMIVTAPGSVGFDAVGEILNGSVNPSARLADTYVYDLTQIPAFEYSGSNTRAFANIADSDAWQEYLSQNPGPISFGLWDTNINYVAYVEGIYVGYKFYETAAAEGLIDYDTTVQYPFGYGLSYTTFEQEISSGELNNGEITFDVTVTNTGDVAGKDVVEVYYTPPYYNGGIEKSEVNLIDFGKTDLLDPGESQTMSFVLSEEDLASYDESGEGSYVIEAGDYNISIRSDSHTVLDEFDITIADEIRYDAENPRSGDVIAASNEFDFAQGDFTYLSRADHFANYEEATTPVVDRDMSEEQQELFYTRQQVATDDSDTMPTTGAKNGIKLESLRGLAYDDPTWDTFLDQMTVDEMCALIDTNGFFTMKNTNLGIKATINSDGPQGFKMLTNGSILGPSGAGEVMTACTWNKALASAFGSNMGDQARQLGISGWYGPALNIHRTAFSGRNYEYFSEDTTLSALLVAEEIQAAQSKGLICYAKHFALNDQEAHRWDNLCTYSNEQAIRETYLRVFETAVKKGGATGIMTSYNLIGPVWTGACEELLTNVLRGEWGFQGCVVTDYNGNQSPMDADITIRAGGDSQLTTTETEYAYIDDRTSATGVSAIRSSTHNMLYALVNSNAYEDGALDNSARAVWEKVLIGSDVVIGLLIIGAEILLIKNGKKGQKSA